MDVRGRCDVAVARAAVVRSRNVGDSLGDPNDFASANGKRVLVAVLARARTAAFTARRDSLPLYRCTACSVLALS